MFIMAVTIWFELKYPEKLEQNNIVVVRRLLIPQKQNKSYSLSAKKAEIMSSR